MTTPLGKYKLVKLIASGGMAEVYLARQAGAAGFEKSVCLKRILPHLARDKQFIDMFLNEARLASRLDHPNIVSIFDLGESNGNYFIAMEFIDGPNLRSVAKRAAELNELLPIAEVVKIIAMAAGGLQYAHDLPGDDGQPLGLVHRDISPDNILVHRNGTVKVVDFGIAKAAGSSGATRTGTLKGKVAYMPPEQLRGEPLDRRTDVFALGVVLYELLGGRRPWDADSEVALIGRIMTEEPQPLTELRDDVPPELVAIVEKALSKDRERRYQSCNEFQHELEQLLVSMGQSITSSRIADFVRAYAPPQEATPEGTGAELSSLQEEAFGTGAAPAILAGGPSSGTHGDPAGDDAGTLSIPQPVLPAKKSRAGLYGGVAFAAILIVGGGVGVFVLQKPSAEDAQPVAVERASVVDTRPAPAPAAVPAPSPAPSPAPARVEAAPAPAPAVERDPKPRPVRVAQVHAEPAPAPAPAPIVVVREAPPAPAPAPAPPPVAPTIAAKGELVVFVRPWATVSIDGKTIGDTPLDPLKLAVGDHVVRLTNDKLGKDITRTVHISASERETLKEILDE